MTEHDHKLMDGRALARRILNDTARTVRTLREQRGITPALATVLVGDDPSSATYVRMKARRCEEVGVRSVALELPRGTTTDELVHDLGRLADDESIHGILLQHPVPAPHRQAGRVSRPSPWSRTSTA